MRLLLSLSRLRLIGASIVLGLGLTGCVTVPTEYREPAPLTAADRTTRNAEVLARAWTLINDHYFDADFRGVDWPAMRAKHEAAILAAADDTALYAALNALCGELKESHLVAIAPRRVHEQRADARALIGVRWQVIEGRRVVTEVMPGSPAEEGGVQPGWIAVARNGNPIDEAHPFVPRVGETVTVEFLDQADRSHVLRLTPRLLPAQRLTSRELPGGFRYLRFDHFNPDAMSWLSRELKTHRAAPGVVLDLRSNPGGNVLVLQVAIAEFFDRRVPTGTFIKRSGTERPTKGLRWFPAEYPGRLAILTSPASGSASEIFAHVMQHHRRGLVIGRTTAGAVILSRQYRLPGGGQLQVPTQDYVGLDGQRLEGRGVTPDHVIAPPTLAEARAATDRELAAALEILAEK